MGYYNGKKILSSVNYVINGGGLEEKTITENGTYKPANGAIGFSKVVANVEPKLQEKEVTENGTVLPDSGYDGLSKVIVNAGQLPTLHTPEATYTSDTTELVITDLYNGCHVEKFGIYLNEVLFTEVESSEYATGNYERKTTATVNLETIARGKGEEQPQTINNYVTVRAKADGFNSSMPTTSMKFVHYYYTDGTDNLRYDGNATYGYTWVSGYTGTGSHAETKPYHWNYDAYYRVTKIESSAFKGNTTLESIIINNSITEIRTKAFNGCSNLKLITFPRAGQVCTLANVDALTGIHADCKIVVPDNLYNSWIVATNWATYASYIVKESEYNG